jgi:alpha-beta hydrolase superfamily lysophospholipase
MAEHGGRYQRFAHALNACGVTVWAHDHRGHGKTSPDDLGHFADSNGWRLLINDAWDVSQQMMAAYPGVPIALFAHSMGSFIGQTLLGERGGSYRAVILCGTNAPPDARERAVRVLSSAQLLTLGPRHPGMWVGSVMLKMFNRRFEPRKTHFDWLSRDEDEVRKYVDDRFCGSPLSARSWFDFLHGKRRLGRKKHLDRIPKTLPIHVIAGTHDPVGEETKGVDRLLNLYKANNLTVSSQFYAGARHELLNETNRGEVTKDLSDWLLRQVDMKPNY